MPKLTSLEWKFPENETDNKFLRFASIKCFRGQNEVSKVKHAAGRRKKCLDRAAKIISKPRYRDANFENILGTPVGSWQTSTFCHVQLSGRKHRPNPGLVMALERHIPKPSGSWPHTWSLGHQGVGWPPELVEWLPALYILCVCLV